MLKIEEHSLENGATVIACPIADARTVAIIFGFRTGSRTENEKNSGASHFLEHMFFKGSEKRPTAKDLSNAFDGLGAYANGATSREYTYYPIQVAKEFFKEALDIYGDMLTRPVLSEEEFEKERGTIIQEFHRSNETPEDHIYYVMEGLIFGENAPMGRHIIGTEKSLTDMKKKDLDDYYKKHYSSSNLVVTIVGAIPDNYLELLRPYVDRLPVGERQNWHPIEFSEKRISLCYRDLEQTQIGLMVPALSIADDDRFVAEVIANILGGNMSSRLFTEIREKRGWAYRVGAYTDENSDNGYFAAFGGVKKENAFEAVEIMKKELIDLAATVTDEEIKRAKENLKGLNAIKYENVLKRGNYLLLTKILSGKIETPEEFSAKIERVTKEEIVTLSKRLFQKDRMYLAVLGDFKDESKFDKILRK